MTDTIPVFIKGKGEVLHLEPAPKINPESRNLIEASAGER